MCKDKFSKKLGIDLNNKLNSLLNNSDFNEQDLFELSRLYDLYELELVAKKETPKVVIDFLCGDYSLNLPDDYAVLTAYVRFMSNIRKKISSNFKKAKEKNKFAQVCNMLLLSSDFDSYYTGFVSSYEDEFLKYKMDEDLIKAYRLSFMNFSNTEWLEKIGDLQYKKGDYDDALNSYLDYAENSNLSSRIYKKMAKVFDKQNDEMSKNACLEQARLLEDSNE